MTAPAYTDRIAAALACFNAPRDGTLTLAARTYEGIGASSAILHPPFAVDGLPLALLNLLNDGFTLRVDLVTRSGPTALWLPMLIARWTLKSSFISSRRLHVVSVSGLAGVRAMIATMPAPTLQVHAGPEVWAGWRLTQPLPAKAAGPALRRLAEQLAADPIENLADTLPLAGAVRNWSNVPREYITIVDVDPSREYELADLHPADATGAAAVPPGVTHERDRSPEAGRGRRPAPARA